MPSSASADAAIPSVARIDEALVDQGLEDATDRVDGDGEADAGGLADLAVDGGRHADDPAAGVEQRAAGVAGVDGGVGLDDALDLAAVLGVERAVEAADDPGRQCPFQAEGVADGEDLLADPQLVAIAQGDREELVGGGVDTDHGHVVVRVGADDLGVED